MKHFKLWNTLCGWLVFAIAAATYLLTMEPTASFWDCGEFISSAVKLDVGHPPGAPFFMLMGHFFSLFASDAPHVAMCVNALSALASAFTILFLFWTITALAKKLVAPDTLWRGIGLLGAGAVGALAYTFSDTFWFSAVEGEVYASSSLFTAVVFWLILKWDEHADEEGSDRWLIAIAYLMGLSIGVHLLNLLTIPAIGLVYYFRRYKFTWPGFIGAFFASCAVLLVILYGIIPGFPTVAGWFELLFVNVLGCSFNTGLAVYLVLVVASLVWAIVETYRDTNKIRVAISFTLAFALSGAAFLFEKWWIGLILSALMIFVLLNRSNKIPARVLNTVAVMIAVIIVGYSSYAALVIRSNAQPPMDQNSPTNVFSLKSYLNREQYGDRPLFYGQTFKAPLKYDETTGLPEMNYGASQYAACIDGPDRYIETGKKISYIYQPEFCTLFPRMYSGVGEHIKAYKAWAGIPDLSAAQTARDSMLVRKALKTRTKTVNVKDGYFAGYDYDEDDNAYPRKKEFCPTFGDNLEFFFSYQVNFMYWRYFMWNFVGRQNDMLSYGDLTKGQWISGIPFIDNARLGDQSLLPKELRENKAHNVYYFLPLLLGVLGIFWQVSKRGKDKSEEGWKNFTLTFLLFFLTGLAIVIYLNQTPNQPRERDYAYAGSFYAFCIWIGMGALALVDWIALGIKKLSKMTEEQENQTSQKVALAAMASLVSIACLGVPALMAQQNWDDHDRSDRYVCRDFGANYLKSCEGNAILFSNGDNDTFPLWYNQEVEGEGDSIRVCNLSYLNTDWYINQMKRPYYNSEGLPISWEQKDYMASNNDYVYAQDIDHTQLLHVLINISDLSSDEKNQLHQEVTSTIKYWEDYGRRNYKEMELRNEEEGRRKGKEYGISQVWREIIQPLQLDYLSVKKAFDFVRSDDEATKNEKDKNYLPANSLYVKGPNGETVDFAPKRAYSRADIMVMEMLSTNQWKRPIYFCITTGNDAYIGLEPYMEQTGLAYQVTPTYRPIGENRQIRVNTEKMYNNMMNRFKYGNVNKKGIYLDENTMRMCLTHRMAFVRLAEELYNEGQKEKALAVLERCEKELPSYNIPNTYGAPYYMYHGSYAMVLLYFQLEKPEKALAIAKDIIESGLEYQRYFDSLNKAQRAAMMESDIPTRVDLAERMLDICKYFEQPEFVAKYEKSF